MKMTSRTIVEAAVLTLAIIEIVVGLAILYG